MDVGKLSYHARKIHRWSMWFVICLGLIQMITGLTMKYPQWFPFFDQSSVRLLHFQTAGWFSLAFGVQMLTGILMYLAPWLLKNMRRPTPPPTKLPN